MSKKWYNYFVSVDDSSSAVQSDSPGAETPATPPASTAQSVAEIARTVAPEPKFSATMSNPTSFDEIYQAAEIPSAPQGYSILKIAEMLQSAHIRSQPVDVKKSSVLVALDAAGVDIKDVIQDAVRRDRALDGYERVQQRAVDDLEARKTRENAQMQTDLDRMIAEQRAKMQKNNDEVTQAKEQFFAWRLKKQQEEKKISEAVGYFVTENPITTSSTASNPEAASNTAKR